MTDPISADDLLITAAQTMRERASERDVEKERAMVKTVALFNAMYPNTPLKEEQGWAFMMFLKLARSSNGAVRIDDYIDLSSYAALMGECAHNTALEISETLRRAS